MTAPRIAIIGAGMAGLTCARALTAAGLAPVVFDKSRGVGGRLATRRAEGGVQFDHGAPYLTATDPGFADLLALAQADGAMAVWMGPLRAPEDGQKAWVGLPGMSGLARWLGQGLDIRLGATVSALTEADSGWRVTVTDQSQDFDRLILTLPAPQILRLLGPDHILSAPLSAVRMSPCLTLMAAFQGPTGTDPAAAHFATDKDLDWIALDSAKPGRDRRMQAWVAQATPEFSNRHLEREMPEVAQRMLPLLCHAIGADPSQAVHAVAHRWRFSRVEVPLGQPFLNDETAGLYLGGDWCLGPDAQDAWTSGCAIARDILKGQ